MSSNPIKFYPYQYMGYSTLSNPNTFTEYCFKPNCPVNSSNTTINYSIYDSDYTKHQIDMYNKGKQLYINSIQPERDWINYPVFNSNLSPPISNFMKYK